MVSKYAKTDFEAEVATFRLETRRQTRKPVEKAGWRVCIGEGQIWLEVAVLDHTGFIRTKNIAI